MNTDRELLELAAKGARFDNWRWVSTFFHVTAFDHRDDLTTKWIQWNPLEDDRDAFRLAARLCMTLEVTQKGATVIGCLSRQMVHVPNKSGLRGLDDACASARLAIVLTAAEVGKAIP